MFRFAKLYCVAERGGFEPPVLQAPFSLLPTTVQYIVNVALAQYCRFLLHPQKHCYTPKVYILFTYQKKPILYVWYAELSQFATYRDIFIKSAPDGQRLEEAAPVQEHRPHLLLGSCFSWSSLFPA